MLARETSTDWSDEGDEDEFRPKKGPKREWD